MVYKWPMHPFSLGTKRSSYSLIRETLEELPAKERRKKEEDVYFYKGNSDVAIKASELNSLCQIYAPAPWFVQVLKIWKIYNHIS